MSYALLYTRAKIGILAPEVAVEVHLSSGLPHFSLVGLPEMAVKESKDRVRSAIINSGFRFPNQRITVNLAPADLPKEGGRYDLAIALSILAASQQIPANKLTTSEFIGELALSGDLRSVKGILPVALACKQTNRALFLPEKNLEEAALIQSACLYPCSSLRQICDLLLNNAPPPPITQTKPQQLEKNLLDMADINGQYQAKRALEIAAAGRHHMLMIGLPGTGKTMLASRLATILPPLTEEQAIEVATIESVANQGFDSKNWLSVRMRSPHHNISAAALIGGGSKPKPGEISLAHHGILFLDELAEFQRNILDNMRTPMESGVVHISRVNMQISYPSKFQLIAAMNPVEDKHGNKASTPFGQKISKPLLDRIDIKIKVPKLKQEDLLQVNTENKTSQEILQSVLLAREKQNLRGVLNSDLSIKQIEKFCTVDEKGKKLLKSAIATLNLSARAYHKSLKVARTIADLENEDKIMDNHIAEALGYRLHDN